MIRIPTTIGIALLAALAFCGAASHSATGAVFLFEVEDTVLTSEVETPLTLTYGGQELTCETTKFTGTVAWTEANEVMIPPTYEGCELGETGAVVRTNHCFLLAQSNTVEEAKQLYAPLQLECEAEEYVEIEIPEWEHCLLKLLPQTTAHGVRYTNEGSGAASTITIKIAAELQLIKSEPKDNAACTEVPAEGTAAISGSLVLKGYQYVSGPTTSFTEDETAAGAERGITHRSWEEGEQTGIKRDYDEALASEPDSAQVIGFSVGDVECEALELSGEPPTESGSVFTPKYEECTAFGATTEVRINGCTYDVSAETEEGHAALEISCAEGKAIEIEIPAWDGCTLKLPPQTINGGVRYRTRGWGRTANVTAVITGEVTVEKKEAEHNEFCTVVPEEESAGYSGSVILKRYEGAAGGFELGFEKYDSDSVVLTAQQKSELRLSYSGSKLECEINNAIGVQDGEPITDMSLVPEYESCEYGSVPAVVRNNRCGYIVTGETVEHEGKKRAPLHVSCEEPEELIEVEIPSFGHCTLTIEPQTATGGVVFENTGSGATADVTATFTADVAMSRDNPGNNFFCSLVASSGTGSYSGSSVIRGYAYTAGPTIEVTEDETATGLARGTMHWGWTEGGQVGIAYPE